MNQKWLAVVLAVALVGTGFSFFIYARRTSADIATLKAQNEAQAQANLAAEQARETKVQVLSAELALLRQNQAELLRLRNEIGQLRETGQALGRQVQAAEQQAQVAAQRLRSVEQSAQAAQLEVQPQGQDPAQAAANAAVDAFRRRYGLVTPQLVANQQACVNNLRQIDGAKQQWALENRKTETAVPLANDLAPYLKDGIPACPQGGGYILNAVGLVPTCTIPGHMLGQ
jgi:hypothetical protein